MSDYVRDLAYQIHRLLERARTGAEGPAGSESLRPAAGALERAVSRARKRGDRGLQQAFGLCADALSCTPWESVTPRQVAVLQDVVGMVADGGRFDPEDVRSVRERLQASGLRLTLPPDGG